MLMADYISFENEYLILNLDTFNDLPKVFAPTLSNFLKSIAILASRARMSPED